ncbi:MAG: OmpA family protein [Clostridia bacterium]|nr:OmpA family protein [Clostridia bacterium]
MTRRKPSPRGRRGDHGGSWISYSDMMAAMMLVFVLILCYSLYQYFLMLETKEQELEDQQTLLTSQQLLLTDQQAQLTTQQAQLDSQQAALDEKETALSAAQTSLKDQQALLDQQAAILNTQQSQLDEAQAALAQKEMDLADAQAQLAAQQTRLEATQYLVETQKEALASQQSKIDDLVGMRTRIIQELSATLQSRNLRATVDPNTGNIVLDSAVFFDTASFTIKDSGKALLDQFVPVYLSVLLRPEYEDYLGSIIIEGHTDTAGEYLMNLELSQQRALAVVKYCLQMRSLTQAQRDKLQEILIATGRSESNPVYYPNGTVDMESSRRVEFTFNLKDAEMIDEMNRILTTNP